MRAAAGVAGVADRGKGELHVGLRPLRGRRILAQAPVGQGVIGGIEAVLVGCPQAFHRAGRGGRPGAVPGPDQRALGFRVIGGERLAVLAAHAHLAHGGIVREKSLDGHAEDIRLHQGGHGRRIGERNIDGGGRLQIGRIDGDGGRFDRRDRVGGHARRRGRLTTTSWKEGSAGASARTGADASCGGLPASSARAESGRRETDPIKPSQMAALRKSRMTLLLIAMKVEDRRFLHQMNFVSVRAHVLLRLTRETSCGFIV